ncbi:MAG: prepilin-type N-terminal cleavage/methylation domain-containing protein [Candidatus Omnitrophica bacterium]|nr:prepilin-type N-terminal cleavage/methylation domain-containing protein [Candidatus Omnitrophota bacterium]
MKIRSRGFSLIELMVVVSILSIGIVLVIRSFLNSAKALNISQNRISAANFLEKKMAELEEKAFLEKGVIPATAQENIKLGFLNATYASEIAPISAEGLDKFLSEAKLDLSWKEGNLTQNAVLGTYFKNKE